MSAPEPPRLSVSIVTYRPNWPQLEGTLGSLRAAAEMAIAEGMLEGISLTLVDHGPGPEWRPRLERLLDRLWAEDPLGPWKLLSPGENLGFGRGHNLAMAETRGDYHLVLNPDVAVAPDALAMALRYLEREPKAGMITPWAVDDAGQRQYLCKQYPSILDLLLRGVASQRLRNRFAQRLARYELRGVTEDAPVSGIRIASGCFMLMRRTILDAVGGFDPRYFLYFEDFDLSLRMAEASAIVYLPDVRIVHYGGGAARKGLRHTFLFARSALTFYRVHGWRWF